MHRPQVKFKQDSFASEKSNNNNGNGNGNGNGIHIFTGVARRNTIWKITKPNHFRYLYQRLMKIILCTVKRYAIETFGA